MPRAQERSTLYSFSNPLWALKNRYFSFISSSNKKPSEVRKADYTIQGYPFGRSLMKIIPLILILLFLFNSLKAFTFPPTESLEIKYQELLPIQFQLVTVQHMRFPGLPKAVVVTYIPLSGVKKGPEAMAALLADGADGPYVVWQSAPIHAIPEPFSGVHFLGPGSRVEVFLFCHAYGASAGVHMEAYRWDGKTFSSVGLKPLDGFDTLTVEFLGNIGEYMVVVRGRYHYVEYLIYENGNLVAAPANYVKEYLLKKSGRSFVPH